MSTRPDTEPTAPAAPGPARSGMAGWGMALGAMLLLPSLAAAQACLGSAAATAQFTLGGDVAFADQGNYYGVSSQANLPGAVSMGARLGAIDRDDFDDNLTSAGANLALDLGRAGISVCPMVALGYDTWSGSFAGVSADYSRLTVPVGVGAGTRLGTGQPAYLIPSARAGLFHARHDGDLSLGGATLSRTDSSTDAFVDLGATVHFGRLYAQGGFFRVFEDNADNVFRVGLGVVF